LTYRDTKEIVGDISLKRYVTLGDTNEDPTLCPLCRLSSVQGKKGGNDGDRGRERTQIGEDRRPDRVKRGRWGDGEGKIVRVRSHSIGRDLIRYGDEYIENPGRAEGNGEETKKKEG